MMGGRDAVLKVARTAIEQKESGWAAELLTHLIRVNANDDEARKLKAEALRQLAYQTDNTNWRNWYITAARELDGTLNQQMAAVTMNSLGSPEILRALPLVKFFEAMTVRLDPAKSADAHLTVAFDITDTRQTYAVEVRRGVAQIHETLPAKTDATLHLPLSVMQRIIARQTSFASALQAGEIKADGDANLLARFNSFLDPPATQAPALTVR
jgi:alkyl sulfatase BDS1-like metallo-beta-lactamase superfamily hydrolase